MSMRGSFVLLLAVAGASAYQQAPVAIKNQGYVPFADAPIHYRSAPLQDPIAKLQKRLDAKEALLQFDPERGYLKSVLEQLQVPVDSQALVFSKTSFQFPQISPATPRALYFNDDVYVGRVHDGKFLEFISFDPVQGAIFYVLNEHSSEQPKFERAMADCVQCHVAASTRGVPGVMLRSVFTKPTGYQAAGTKSYVSGHESPYSERWGGWYVTGSHAGGSDMGNATTAAAVTMSSQLRRSDYLTDTSDIVALMVLAHQTQMHNLITQVNYQARLGAVSKTPEAREKLERYSEQLVQYLLFANEAPLEGMVSPSSTFAKEFAARGPFDQRGRSLRQFDLKGRLFRYPCSYLVYSDDFVALPEPAKSYIYRRLFEVLNGSDTSEAFRTLTAEDRRSIFEILVATKHDLPREWGEFLNNTQRPHEPALSATSRK